MSRLSSLLKDEMLSPLRSSVTFDTCTNNSLPATNLVDSSRDLRFANSLASMSTEVADRADKLDGPLTMTGAAPGTSILCPSSVLWQYPPTDAADVTEVKREEVESVLVQASTSTRG